MFLYLPTVPNEQVGVIVLLIVQLILWSGSKVSTSICLYYHDKNYYLHETQIHIFVSRQLEREECDFPTLTLCTNIKL
jgi:hypothetical protein